MTTQTAAPGFASFEEFRDAHRRTGGHFFDADAMRFFRSRIVEELYAGRFFITSEQFEGSDGHRDPRAYSVRIANLDGSIGAHVGEFQAYATLALARKAAQAAATGYAQALDAPAIESVAPDAYTIAYNAGHHLRQFEAGWARDQYGNRRSDYIRQDAKRLQAQADALTAEADALDAAGVDR